MTQPPDDPLAEVTLDSALAWEGEFLRVYRDRVRCPDGHLAPREFLRHPGAVMVIPLLADGRVVLERQYRYALGRSFVEFPAGKYERDESPLACGRRELLEETGYIAARWTLLGSFHNAIGYCDERIDVLLAQDLTRGTAASDAGEVLEVFTWPWQQVLDGVRRGEITDVKTIVGVHWLAEHLAGRWPGRVPHAEPRTLR